MNGNPIYEGRRVPSDDPCKVNCVCLNGEHVCAEYGCAAPPPGIAGCQPINRPGECCPSYDHCEQGMCSLLEFYIYYIVQNVDVTSHFILYSMATFTREVHTNINNRSQKRTIAC